MFKLWTCFKFPGWRQKKSINHITVPTCPHSLLSSKFCKTWTAICGSIPLRPLRGSRFMVIFLQGRGALLMTYLELRLGRTQWPSGLMWSQQADCVFAYRGTRLDSTWLNQSRKQCWLPSGGPVNKMQNGRPGFYANPAAALVWTKVRSDACWCEIPGGPRRAQATKPESLYKCSTHHHLMCCTWSMLEHLWQKNIEKSCIFLSSN